MNVRGWVEFKMAQWSFNPERLIRVARKHNIALDKSPTNWFRWHKLEAVPEILFFLPFLPLVLLALLCAVTFNFLRGFRSRWAEYRD